VVNGHHQQQQEQQEQQQQKQYTHQHQHPAVSSNAQHPLSPPQLSSSPPPPPSSFSFTVKTSTKVLVAHAGSAEEVGGRRYQYRYISCVQGKAATVFARAHNRVYIACGICIYIQCTKFDEYHTKTSMHAEIAYMPNIH
jgi:hypothetical protein